MFQVWESQILPKLKREWKTAAFLLADAFVEGYDSLSGFVGFDPMIPPQYRDIWHIAVPVIALLLRRWRDHVKTDNNRIDPGIIQPLPPA